VLILLLLFVVLFIGSKSFENKVRQHSQTPQSMGIAFSEISIPTKNARKLYGWMLKNGKELPTVILMHGWGRNVERVLPYIQNLYDQDFNLVAFDSRNHGSSDRDDYSTMVKFAEDISAAIDFIREDGYFENDAIGIVGLSIGGAASIYAAARDSRITSVATVGAFSNPYEVMKETLQQHHIPFMPMGWLIMKYLEFRVGFTFKSVAPEKHIGKSDAQFLLIHGDADETIAPGHLGRLTRSAKSGNASSWMIPSRGHSNCHLEEGFWERLTDHLKKTLNPKPPAALT
jgi:pimeloyl-ACP methyl ester carboxylesterase